MNLMRFGGWTTPQNEEVFIVNFPFPHRRRLCIRGLSRLGSLHGCEKVLFNRMQWAPHLTRVPEMFGGQFSQ